MTEEKSRARQPWSLRNAAKLNCQCPWAKSLVISGQSECPFVPAESCPCYTHPNDPKLLLNAAHTELCFIERSERWKYGYDGEGGLVERPTQDYTTIINPKRYRAGKVYQPSVTEEDSSRDASAS